MDYPMRLDRDGKEFIKSLEGLKLTPYQDEAGVWTVGWGHTEGIDRLTPTIDKKQAELLFDEDVDVCESVLHQLVLIKLAQCEFNALVSFVFNLGESAFKRSTLLQKLNAGDKRGAAKEFDRWVYTKSGPNHEPRVSPGLQRRRELEKALFLSATNSAIGNLG